MRNDALVREIHALRAQVGRLTYMLNLSDVQERPDLLPRTRTVLREDRDGAARELGRVVEEARERGDLTEEEAEDALRPATGDLDDAKAFATVGRPKREPVHWPAPRYCEAPGCGRVLPVDATPRRRFCGRYCGSKAGRARRRAQAPA